MLIKKRRSPAGIENTEPFVSLPDNPFPEIELELWKIVPIALKYEASSLGRIRSSSDKTIVESKPGSKGYLCVGGWRVHCLVLNAFHGPKPFPEAQCRHLNGNNQNNRPDNLKWGTAKENSEDRIRHGKSRNSPETRAKLSEACKGRINSPEARAKMSAIRKGRPLSETAKANMSKSRKGRKQTPEHIANRVAARWRNGTYSKDGDKPPTNEEEIDL